MLASELKHLLTNRVTQSSKAPRVGNNCFWEIRIVSCDLSQIDDIAIENGRFE